MNSLINFIFVAGVHVSIAEVRENRKGIKENYLISILLTSYIYLVQLLPLWGDCVDCPLIEQGFQKTGICMEIPTGIAGFPLR